MPTLRFEAGTLALLGAEKDDPRVPELLTWDARTACFRAPAVAYAATVLALRREGVVYEDEARRYEELAHGALSLIHI